MQQCMEVIIFSLFYGYNIVNYIRCKGIFKGNYSENLFKKMLKFFVQIEMKKMQKRENVRCFNGSYHATFR